MSRTALAFMSYVNLDDQHEQGRLTRFRECLSGEVRMQTGEPFDIFQDRKDIAWGQQWQERINQSLDAVTFLIPIITPGFFKSKACREELERFLKREAELKRGDLILPVYYVNCPVLSDKAKREDDKLAQVIAERQYADWRDLRFEEFTSPQIRKALAKMAEQIVAALERRHSDNIIELKESKVAPTVETESPTVVVDQHNRGDYITITEAIESVKSGAKILVKPGFYKESIVINKTVEVIGDGKRSEIVIEAYDNEVIVFRADNGRIANLTLRQVGLGWSYCIHIAAQGRLSLEDCDISGEGMVCVSISGNADLCCNRIHDGVVGICIGHTDKVTLKDNEITANKGSGVMITSGGNPTLCGNRINQNAWYGIQVDRGGSGIFEDNDLRDNRLGAWHIEPDCEVFVQRRGNKE